MAEQGSTSTTESPDLAPLALARRWIEILGDSAHRTQILELAGRYPTERSLNLPFGEIDRVDGRLADQLLEYPDRILRAGRSAMLELLPVTGPESEALRMRVIGLPERAQRTVRTLRQDQLHRMVAVRGQIRECGEVLLQIVDAVYSCLACRGAVHVGHTTAESIAREPDECPHCGKMAPRQTKFRLLEEKSVYVDAQRVSLEHSPESPAEDRGRQPRLAALLTEDLVGRLDQVEGVTLNGTLEMDPRSRGTTAGFLLLVNSIEIDTPMVLDARAVGTEASRLTALELISVIRGLQTSGDRTFTFDQLMAGATDRGIPRPRAESLFQLMRNQGELIEQRPGVWQMLSFD